MLGQAFQGSGTCGLLVPTLTSETSLPVALVWAALFLWILIAATWAAYAPTTVRSRSCAAILVALAPLLCPGRGLLSTLLTGLAVVFAVRMPDLERERPRKSFFELLLWLTLPVFYAFPRSLDLRKQNRARAASTLLEAILTFAAWIPVCLFMKAAEPASWAWPFRSAALIFFFVLTVTGLEALLRALVQATGATTERLFERPLFATSLRDFWGRRWNKFIARFALRHIAMRRRSKTNGPRSVLTVFLWSAVFHEYFALGASGAGSQPGHMLLFFLIQGVGMLAADRIALEPPRPLATLLTALWMVFTAPLFFAPLRAPLLELGYPAAWFVPTQQGEATESE